MSLAAALRAAGFDPSVAAVLKHGRRCSFWNITRNNDHATCNCAVAKVAALLKKRK